MSSKKQMVINYVPGEECRVAIVENGNLEELHGERMDGPSSHVGNIYVGKVVNVEPAIQAAFIDFGLEQNGFLHISDVHPQYFPGEDSESTERVGKKTPRRDRPPIQECFRRGDEVAVQVLKEGVGTKGPTVTSYLSIPGRFLVMMPQMDRVGVSRKVEDEEQRRKMREILDQLDLPEGFGFILRTAGMERTKAELKRDLAYLQRLWKDMEKRWRTGSKPRLLYSESDLLVRALRDMLTSDIEEVVVDNPAALNRAARFLKIVAPRTTTKIVYFTGKAPVFHVLGIEPQIQMIHAREVPLPSGGRLVIDEAEALVAIDVNSGKSRDARDAETNAYRTNLEACDEICRQLRLRDIGGVIINDLIDMRFSKHRRDIEIRFRENLKKDRARWTIAPISEFGILEMTRQRMRGSHESQHFADCPTCRGRGLLQRPDSVAADSLRELAAISDAQRVHRIEMVVHPRIAGELLSHQRRSLTRLEHLSGKHVDVRVSEAIAVDRTTFYAYDDRGADLDLATLARPQPRAEEFQEYAIARDAAPEEEPIEQEPEAAELPEPEPVELEAEPDLHPIELDTEGPLDNFQDGAPVPDQSGQAPVDDDGGERHGRRRRRRGRRGRGRAEQPGADGFAPPPEHPAPHAGAEPGAERFAPQDLGGGEQFEAPAEFDESAAPAYGGPGAEHPLGPSDTPPGGVGGPGGGKRRRRRRGRRGRGGSTGPAGQPGGAGYPGMPVEPGVGFGAQDGFSDSPEHAGQPSHYAEPGGESGQPGYDQPGYDQAAHQPPMEGESAGELSQQDFQHGPDQGHPHPTQDGPSGPGGPRRRRRRRGRRGRGGGSGPAGQPGGGADQGAPVDGAINGHYPIAFGDQRPSDGPPEGEFDARAEHGQESPQPFEASGEFGGTGGGFAQGPQDGPPGGKRRRRRRRGRGQGQGQVEGQGGHGGRGSPDMSGSQGQPHHGHHAGPPQGPREPRGQDQRGNRPGRGDGRQGRAPGNPPPPSSPAPQPTGAPKPRTLYSSRRRLGPGDLKVPKRED